MRKIYVLLLAASLLGFSCSDKAEGNGSESATEREVELRIVQTGSGTRAAAVPYPAAAGTNEEKQILTLNIVAFDAGTKKFAYVRSAYPGVNGAYRAIVPTEYPTVDIALLANCPNTALQEVLDSSPQYWEDFRRALVDNNPQRLSHPENFRPLPMASDIIPGKALVSTGIANWGTVQLLRSVASVDVLMEKNTATSKLELTKVHIYNAANKGYITPIKETGTTPQQYQTPVGMATALNTLTAVRIAETQTSTSPVVTYNAVTSQLFMYDNNTLTNHPGNGNKCTRVIVEGYYDQAAVTGAKKPSFYPVFLVDETNNFRPVIRNNKYVLEVNAVYGPGYETITEAAEGAPIHLNVDVVNWDLADVEVGVSGPYYVSIDKKTAYLERNIGATDEVLLTYKGEENDTFKINFETTGNGPQVDTADGIENNRFGVALKPDSDTVVMEVKAKGAYSATDSQNHDVVVISYRNLTFKVAVHQLNQHEDDWNNGGDIPTDL
jgi:hypothetical protein